MRAAVGAAHAVPQQARAQHLRPAAVQRLLRHGVRVPRRVSLPTRAVGDRLRGFLRRGVGEDERAPDGAAASGAARGRRAVHRRVHRGRRRAFNAAGGRVRVPSHVPGLLRREGV